jgi:abortive infection bacteriophage resistance protein
LEFFSVAINRKPYCGIDELVDLYLRPRGLIFSKEEELELKQYLRNIGYYRLSGYFWYFYEDDDTKEHRFFEGTQWRDIKHLYDYDEQLRFIFFKAVLQVEVFLKAVVCDVIGKNTQNSEWLYDVLQFKKTTQHQSILKKIKETLEQYKDSKVPYIRASDIPHETWKVFMLFSFGNIFYILDKLNSTNLTLVANQFNLPARDFKNILQGLKQVRNICAHSSRLWNIRHNKLPMLPSFLFHQAPLSYNKIYEQPDKKHEGTQQYLINAIMSLYLILKRTDAPHADAFLHDIDTWIKAFVPIEDLNNPYVRSLGLKTDWEKYVQTMQSF